MWAGRCSRAGTSAISSLWAINGGALRVLRNSPQLSHTPSARPWSLPGAAPSLACFSTSQQPLSSTSDPSTSQPTQAAASTGPTGRSRAYPTEPRVGVGVVVFRTLPLRGRGAHDAEILLVRRGKEPDKGKWCFPGGSLELGETLVGCAAREVMEEAGLQLRGAEGELGQRGSNGGDDEAGGKASAMEDVTRVQEAGEHAPASHSGGSEEEDGGAWDLRNGPTPFAAVDVMRRDPDGRMRFHYVVVEVAALAADPAAPPTPGDDADGARWVAVRALRGMGDLTVRCDEMAEEAVRRFGVPPPPTA